jgi:hypothetical protein
MTTFRSDGRPVAALRDAGRPHPSANAARYATSVAARALLLAVVLLPAATRAAPQVGDRIALTACPHPGVTAPCLTIAGADGTVYNITGATPKPPLNGRMIRLRATVSDKLSACLQGRVLDRIRWTPVRQKCTN